MNFPIGNLIVTAQTYWKHREGFPAVFMLFNVYLAANYITLEIVNFRITIERNDARPFLGV